MVDKLTQSYRKNTHVAHWVVRFAPRRTKWLDIVARGNFTLRGVKSAVARKHLAAMQLGDLVLFYQTEQDQAVVGVMQVSRTAYPDPTSADPQWLTCDFVPMQSFKKPVSLLQLREMEQFAAAPLIRQSRVAVVPISAHEYEMIKNLNLPL